MNEMDHVQHFILHPCEKKEINIQQCWISPSVISILGIPLGSYIQICLDMRTVLCRVWPSKPSKELHLWYDDTVSLNYCKQDLLGLENKISILKTSKAEAVNVTVVLKDWSRFENWKDVPGVQRRLQNNCLKCLRGLCVLPQCSVSLKTSSLAQAYGICSVVVNAKTPDTSQAVVIHEGTEININKIESEERHNLLIHHKQPIGGTKLVIEALKDLIQLPLEHADAFKYLGVPHPRGVLLRGPPGCGKTTIIKHISQICGAALVVINGPEVLGPHPGESEEKIQKIFQQAVRLSKEGPCILFIDEIDALCPRRGKAAQAHSSRVTSAVMLSMDCLQQTEGLVVIGATNRPSALDPALRRPGRFDREVLMNVPDRPQRKDILEIHCANMLLDETVDMDRLAALTNGYVGADLASLCSEAAYLAMEETVSSLLGDLSQVCPVTMSHFLTVFKTLRPSLQKDAVGLVSLQPVAWTDIGGLDDVKIKIKQAVEWPMLHPEAFRRMGLPRTKGVLLYGPPGCCKTTLVRAAATAIRSSFVALSGAQLYSPFVGDSERMIAEVFQKARALSPSILFLDEIDSIVGKRSESGSHRGVQERVLSALLNEMDGIGIRLDDKTDSVRERELEGSSHTKTSTQELHTVDENKVLVVAATNRPDLVDDAILRPGRIDRIIYIPPPDQQTRMEILKVHTKKMPVEDVNLEDLAKDTEFYTGADLENLCKEAGMCALSENFDTSSVNSRHFQKALHIVKPSLNSELVEKYKSLDHSNIYFNKIDKIS
ncbi:spermatogenesis-associated protein 5-like protein 1 [Gigantopelta aegis]|uniref:spermatogenesis-associated protein 5-like protein 1 n=1 Tax=Gigantopelta aegis TaxID=1735272 RepID=UPI001B889364|nr:spermatogenesis-associated protein 5-like protein 1 [Gigantopelta aegis]